MNTKKSPNGSTRRQFIQKMITDFQSSCAALTPNVPYAAGTSTLLTMGGVEPAWAIFFGLLVGWLNKVPKK